MDTNMIIRRTLVPEEFLQSCQRTSDVKIVCSDGECYSNRIFLFYMSKLFKSLIKAHMEEYPGQEIVFIIPEISQKHFQMMLDLALEGQAFCKSEAELERFQNAVEYLQWRPNDCLEVDYVQDEHLSDANIQYSSEDSGNSGSNESRSSLDASSSSSGGRPSKRKRNRKNNAATGTSKQSDDEESGNDSDRTVILFGDRVKNKKAKQVETSRQGIKSKQIPIIKLEKIEQPITLYEDDDYVPDPFLEFSANQVQEPDTTQNPIRSQPIFEMKIFESKLGFLNADVFNVSHDMVDVSIFPVNPVNVAGRMKPSLVLDFINQCRGVKEIITMRLAPKQNEGPDYEKYKTFFSYYVSKDRVCHLKCKDSAFSHYYLIPLPKASPIHQALLPFNGPALAENREDCLLAVGLRQLEIPVLIPSERPQRSSHHNPENPQTKSQSSKSGSSRHQESKRGASVRERY